MSISNTPSIPTIRTIIPIMPWNPPSHFANFSNDFPIAGIAGNIPTIMMKPASIATMLSISQPSVLSITIAYST